jgi:tetratricopeptide (TPR) repeat protein
MTDLPCPPQHWSRFSTLLDLAMDLTEVEREDWLRSLQGEDEALRPWLARVLGSAASVSTSDFLENPMLPAEWPADFEVGDVIGPYRLLAPLGEGGMGRVWRALRCDEGPSREVALKLPHAELLAGPFRARFSRERDVLAGLSHPNIAALYDAGVSASGHPYLALELLDGKQITTHCREAGLPLEPRVELVRQVLSALAYAHGRLIVHRDIKPNNVLVTQGGVVKLLDFGIAKLLGGGDPPEGQALTQPLARLASPGYAPPEQMEGGQITVAADLFSVGVLLFELCTGHRPPRLHTGGEEAPLASSKAEASCAGLPEGAGLRRRLRGDLDAIIARALSIDPSGRYGTADAFSADLRRWLGGLPVSARRVGPLAVAGKFVRRNRAAVALAAMLVLALAGGVGGSAWQARRAEREATRAVAIKDFLIGLFRQGDAAHAGKRMDTMTARDMLDTGADRAGVAFAHDPATEIELLETLGKIYDWSDEPTRAERVWRRRLDLETALYGPDDPRVVEGATTLATSLVMFLHDDDAKALLERVRVPLFQNSSPASLPRAEWLLTYAMALRATHGGREDALAKTQAAIAIFKAHFPNDPHYHDALQNLEDYQYDNEDYAASLATLEASRSMDTARHDFDPGDDLVYHIDSASRLERMGQYAEADARYAWAQAQAERMFGKTSLWYFYALGGRAQIAHMRGDRATAAQFFAQALGVNQSRAALSGSSTSLRRLYGGALAREGRAQDAIPILEQVLKETELHGHDEQNLRRTRGLLGDAYDQAGRTEDARSLLSAARADWIKYGPYDGISALGARERWARFLMSHGESNAAAAEFRLIVEKGQGRHLAPIALAEAGLARIALAGGSLELAKVHAEQAKNMIAGVTMEYDIRANVDIALARAEVFAADGDAGNARVLATQARDNASTWDAPDSPQAARVAAFLGSLTKEPK